MMSKEEISKENDTDLKKLLKWLKDAEESKPEVSYRETSLEDYKFYAGEQDTEEVLLKLTDQKRPATVYNEVKPKIDMLVGMAAQTKHEVTVIPVGIEDEPLAELMGGTLKHYQRKLKITRKELECFEHSVKGGRSMLFFYIDKENPFEPKIKASRYEGRHFFLDPDAQEYDLSDARYLFLEKWLTEDEIKQFWPDFDTSMAEQTGRGVDEPSFFDEARNKFRIIEGWYYKYVEVIYFVNPMSGKVEWLNEEDFKKYLLALEEGIPTDNKGNLYKHQGELSHQKSIKKQCHYMLFSGTQFFEGGISPLNWEGFPATFYGAYKAYDTNAWFGAVTTMKDPQRTLNTNRRQLVHLLQTLPKGILLHEVNAILNIDEYEERSSEPNYHLEVSKGSLDKVKFIQQPRISSIYSLFDSICVQSIKDASGAQDSLMGIQTTGREPGITVKARQETGIAVLYVLFDNFRESRFNTGKLLMSLIQQYVKEEEVVRLEGEQGIELTKINSQINPQNEGFNDITAGKFDYVVSETAETMTIRAATAQMLVDFSHNNPGMIPPDVILDYTDLAYSAKEKVKAFHQASQEAEQEERDREYDLRVKEIEVKRNNKTEKREESK